MASRPNSHSRPHNGDRGVNGRSGPKASGSTTPSSSSFPPSYTHHHDYAHTQEISTYLQTFIPTIIPTIAEYEAKESARLILEKLAGQVSPGAKLLPFGSMANGFALKNSDMDLCCCLGSDAPSREPAELVEVLGRLIAQETAFQVKMLPRARIPIIKLTIPPTSTVPFAMACDIGFENRLALENTRLLLTYAMVDPRLRTMVLFLKVWTKRRKINNPYRGTLSSYGYVLLVIHFLTHVKSPPVLPNLQRLLPTRPIPLEELEFEGHDIYFFDDLDALPRIWQTSNKESVGELLIDFFRYFSKDFNYNTTVVSIRSEEGYLTKEGKGWHTDSEYDPEVIVRDLHKLCIEDPFQLDYNVARTVTRDGLYTIRGEFMRALRLLVVRQDRVSAIISEVCEEREDFLVPHPPVSATSPRRRSAPSPRIVPSGNGHGGSNIGGQVPLPAVMSDFRVWAALRGVNGVAGLESAVDPRAFGGGVGLDDAWDERSPTSAYMSLQPAPQNYHQSQPRRPPNRHQPPQMPYARSNPPSSPHSLERRISWDGSGASTSSTTAYDLHRFFQNQPGDVVQSASSPFDRANLTAPSSPALGSTSMYPAFGAPGRPPYRYVGSDGMPDGRPFVGPRMAASLPRSHHSSMYQPAPAPIFPEEDREAVALANSITFGNFPPSHAAMPSAYPYAYAASSGSSSAYGGGSVQTSPTDSLHAFGLTETDEEYANNGRGRTDGTLPADNLGGRPRGRSVPHVRVGPDGCASILFGEISVILPRAHDGVEEDVLQTTTLPSPPASPPPPPPPPTPATTGKDVEAVPLPTVPSSPPRPRRAPSPSSPRSSAHASGDTDASLATPLPRANGWGVTTSPPSVNGWGVGNTPSLPSANDWGVTTSNVELAPTSPSTGPVPLTFAGALRSPKVVPERKVVDGMATLRLADDPEEKRDLGKERLERNR